MSMMHITPIPLALCSGPLTLENYPAALTHESWQSFGHSSSTPSPLLPVHKTRDEHVSNQLNSASEAIRKIIEFTSADVHDRLSEATNAISSYLSRATILHGGCQIWAPDFLRCVRGPVMPLDQLNDVLKEVQGKLDSTDYKLYAEAEAAYRNDSQKLESLLHESPNKTSLVIQSLEDVATGIEALNRSMQELKVHAERLHQIWK